MKTLILSLIASIFAISAYASNVRSVPLLKRVATCTADLNSQNPIKGYFINVDQDLYRGNLQATIFPNCPTCLVTPTVIPVQEKSHNSFLIYFGPNFHLQIQLYSYHYLPLGSYQAVAQTPSISSGNPTRFICKL